MHARMCESLGLHDFIAVYVSHGMECYGAVLQHTSGWSITYVGFTSLLSVAQGSDDVKATQQIQDRLNVW